MADSSITPISVKMNFADVRLPEVKKAPGKYPYLRFGEDNNFPETLLYYYNKSAKHNAIVTGKSNYIIGNGLQTDNQQAEAWSKSVNRYNESLQEIAKKFITDCEVNGGFYVEEIWDVNGRLAEIYHHEFHTVRISEDRKTFYIKKDWTNIREQPIEIPATIAGKNTGRTMQAFKEYRSGGGMYAIPCYIGALNYIETDIEISKFHLSAIKNGLFPSWAVTFNNGDPGEEAKGEIEKGIKRKFAGSENAGTFWIIYNDDPAKAPTFQDLSNTNLDKHFEVLAKRVQDEIFIGHGVTNPMLFGVKTEGQLGGATELRTSYEIFQQTYVSKKQNQAEEYLNSLASLAGIQNAGFKIIPAEPVGVQFSEAIIREFAPKEWIIERLGIDMTKYQPVAPSGATIAPQEQAMANDNLKNLTGKQWIQIKRTIREYGKGTINLAQAQMLLKQGFGLTDDDVNVLLGVEPEEFNQQYDEVSTAELFAGCGESRQEYDIVFSGEADFSGSWEMNFSANNQIQANVLDLIRKNKYIGNEEIAEVLKISPLQAAANLAALEAQGLIKTETKTIGQDTVTERVLVGPLNKATGDYKPETKQIFLRYSYEVRPGVGAPVIATTRPFCKRLIELDKFYSRSDIEQISERVGYSVWDRRGGWWGDSPVCRHYWKVNILTKKA